MKLFNSLLFSFLLVATVGRAQSDFRAAYVVNTRLDTLRGFIDYRSDAEMAQSCRFKDGSSNKEVQYYPETILAYRFPKGRFFVSKQVGKKKVFLEYLFKGKMSILYFRDQQTDQYFIETADAGLVELPYEEGIKERNGAEYFYKSVKHIGLLKYHTKDAPQLQSTIEKIERPQHKNLIALAQSYHKLAAPKGTVVAFQSQVPASKIELEGVLGLLQLPNYTTNGTLQNTCLGILAHFWLPRIGEKLYVRTGFLYASFQDRRTNIRLLKIPLQVEYRLPLGRIEPKAAIGINLHNPFYIWRSNSSETTGIKQALLLGANLKFNKKFSFSINLDLDYTPKGSFPILPGSLFTNAMTVGLQATF